MKNTETYTGRLIDLIREKSSINGNPRYTCVLMTEAGTVFHFKTKPDSSFGYSVPNYIDKPVKVTVGLYRNVLTLADIEAA